MSQPTLTIEECRARQRRLLEVMRRDAIDLVVVTRIEHVQWLTGFRCVFLGTPAAALESDGRVTLVCPAKAPLEAAADSIVAYEGKSCSTWRNDTGHAAAIALHDALKDRPQPGRVGTEGACTGAHFTAPWLEATPAATLVDIEPALFRLRRTKHADELALLRKAIAGSGRMYERAREIIRPGINELEMFNELQSVCVREYGEMLTGTGNDYQSCSRGGPPRDREALAGELYILDLGPAYRGYYADNSRTLAVDGHPTDAQLKAWEQVTAVFELVEKTVRPGASCRALYAEVHRRLGQFMPGSFNHHLGHGIGLNPHEGPHVNPNWDETFELHDVFTIEPGLYGPELNVGMRLENDYLVTMDGVELLSPFPLEL